ncbi:hypothetical protein [Bradyrhizobium tropiciagri]|uniref:hypothetical protein n=1 Tax=Bradyrhizobium tropiciagri TaxID=312253 RepID=UPI002011A7BD|nr:hypothetical protein [Bradyrhizobium tropiciagri]
MTDPAIGPDSLTMAIALGGRPEDNAKMVWSRGCIAYFFPSKSAKAMPHSFRRPFRKCCGATKRNLVAATAQQFCCKNAGLIARLDYKYELYQSVK